MRPQFNNASDSRRPHGSSYLILLWILAPRAGFEPATIRLTVECSTAELPRNRRNRRGFATGQRITKPPSLAKREMGRSSATSTGDANGLCDQGLLALLTNRRLRSGVPSGNSASRPCREPSPKKTHSQPIPTLRRGVARGDSMPDTETDALGPSIVPSKIPSRIPEMSDDECLVRLAQAVRDHDSDRLDEVARLIGRLVVPIE